MNYNIVKSSYWLILLASFMTFACGEDDGAAQSDEDKEESKSEIKITFSIEVGGNYPNSKKVNASVEYSNGSGTQQEQVSVTDKWEKVVTVSEGHNLYYRVVGEVISGSVVVRAVAVSEESGNVIFSDSNSDEVPFQSSADFDFELKASNLGD